MLSIKEFRRRVIRNIATTSLSACGALVTISAHGAEVVVPGTGWHFNHEPPFVPTRIRGYPSTQDAIDGLSRQLMQPENCPDPDTLLRMDVRVSWSIYPVNGHMQLWCYHPNKEGPGESQRFAAECPGNTTSPDPSLSTLSFVACRYFSGSQVPAKNVGPPATCAGNPINPGTGNKWQHEVDYQGIGTNRLEFSRGYNSAFESKSSLGVQWRSTYERRLVIPSPASNLYVGALRPDGRHLGFQLVGTTWTADADIADKLTQTIDTSGDTLGWIYTQADTETAESYDTNGRLAAITDRDGYSRVLSYDTAGQLVTVTDSFGRTLNFTYDALGRIATMTDPDGQPYQYTYTGRTLSTVTHPDGSARTYVYNEPANTSGANLPHALTGIVDEQGVRYATFKYDTTGKAISTEHAGGADKVTINYAANTTVTDALGTARTYSFQTLVGVVKNTGISAPCASCGGAAQSKSYDINGNVASKTDFNGSKTCHAHDLSRNLETARVEGLAPGVSCPANLSTYTPAPGTRQRKITTQWHATYRLPVQIDEPGKRTTFTHDASGNVLTRTELDTATNESRTWSYSYNNFGRVLTADGPRTDVSDETTYTYYNCVTGYQCGQVHTITNAAGHVSTYNTYNAHGQPLTMTDPNGVVTTLTYDLRQRLTARSVGAESTTFEYWPAGMLKKTTLPDGSYLEYTYDDAHRLTDINDAEGNRIHYTLDLMGNRTAEQAYDPSNALTRTRTRVFNALNRLQQEIGASGTPNVTTTFGYDNNGNQTSIAAPLGRDTTQGYDELNRLKQVTDPLNGVTQYGYNALDQLISVTDPRGLITSYSYNALGDLQEQTSPDTGVTTNTYDSAGNLATSTDARNATTTYTYDTLDRVVTASFASGGTTDQVLSYTYDAGTHGKGQLTGVSDSNHSLSWAYDDQGRVLTSNQTVGSVSKSTSYAYANGLRQSMTTPSGQVISYGYTNGKITSISVNGTVLVSNILYDPFGPVRQWTWGNGSLSARTFDQDGNVTQIDSAGLRTYTYDDAFRITGITDTTDPALSWTYGYDDLDRLASASKTGTTLGYTYDANGNRLTQTGSSPSAFTIAANSNRLSSTSGALARSYNYDYAGNTTSFSGVTFAYNNRGRMQSSTRNAVTTSYTYNALGQLIKKGTNTLYYYDEAGHIMGIYDGSGELIEEIVWLGDIPIATLRPGVGGEVDIHNIHTDHLNTPRLITDSISNAARWRWHGEPFGGGSIDNDPSGVGAFDFQLRFPGQIAVAETGLYYNYFRDYDPSTGRYVQSDPIGLDGGINTYLYAEADPISMVDPTGEAAGAAAGAAAIGAAAWRICSRIPKCAAKLAELAKKAVELCKTVDCTVRFDKKGHPFDIPGVGIRLCMHWQIDCHIKGVKGSGFSIHSRLPICYKRGDPIPPARPPSSLP